jgi:prepilin-type processing-associated H-X9-DG protein
MFPTSYLERTPFVSLLPYLDQNPLAVEIENTVPPMDGEGNNSYQPWRTTIDTLLCPSDDAEEQGNDNSHADTNYAMCWGDTPEGGGKEWTGPDQGKLRGVWVYSRTRGGIGMTFASVRDGTVNTMMFGEVGRASSGRRFQGGLIRGVAGANDNGTSPTVCIDAATNPNRPGIYVDNPAYPYRAVRGDSWVDAQPAESGFNAILPPNGPSCHYGTENYHVRQDNGGFMTAGSYHGGGVHVGMVDGSTQFISDAIDAGTPDSGGNLPGHTGTGPSPYGTWGALSTRDGGEVFNGAF